MNTSSSSEKIEPTDRTAAAIIDPNNKNNGTPDTNLMDPEIMLSAIDSDDYYPLLLQGCHVSMNTYKVVQAAYEKLFNLTEIHDKYADFLNEKNIPRLLRSSADDRLLQFDPDDETSVTGLTVGQAYVRENLYHILHNLSRLLANDGYYPILYTSGLLICPLLHPRYLQLTETEDDDDEEATEISPPMPASQIPALVEWVEEILDLADEAVRGLPLVIPATETVDERILSVWKQLSSLAERYMGTTETTLAASTDTSESTDKENPLLYPIHQGCAWAEDICRNIIEINQVLNDKVSGINANTAETNTSSPTSEDATEANVPSSATTKHSTNEGTTPKRTLDSADTGPGTSTAPSSSNRTKQAKMGENATESNTN